MLGQLIENVKYDQVIAPVQSATEATLYNGSAITVSNNGIDCKDFDEVNFILNAGTFVGSAALDIAIVESDTNNPSTATAISGKNSAQSTVSAAFTQVTTANDNSVLTGSLFTRNRKRYLWARSYQNAATCVFSVLASKNSNSAPVSQTVDFDIQF